MRSLIYLLFFLFNLSLFAQEYFPDNEGVKQQTDITYVFTNATIVDGYDNMMRSGQLMIKADKIVAVGKNISIPKDAVIIDLEGKYIYPSFVELFSDFGIKDFKRPSSNGQPQYGPSRDGYYWNDHVRPEQNLTNYFDFDEKTAKQLRKAGYGLVNTHVDDGIIRGTSSLIALSESEDITKTLVAEQTAQVFSFERSNQTRQSYPTSIMGKMALIRQVYNDAEWYQTGNAKNKDLSLEAFNQQQDIPQIFHTDDYLDALRADKVGDEFGVQYTIIGSGDEYKRIKEIKQTNAQFILPLNFPKAYDVENPYLTQYLSLSDMKEWHHAPYLFKRFEDNQISFAITANGLKSPDKLLTHLKTAIEKGLSKEKALDALTQKPAEFLKLSDQVGHLKPGAYANFLITSKDIFEDNMTIYQNWVMGQKHELADMNLVDISGEYQLSFNNQTYDLKLKQNKGKYSAELTKDTLKFGTKLNYKDHWFYLTVTDKSSENEFNRLAARIDQPESDFKGKVFLNNEVTSNFVAKYQDSKKNKKDDKSSDKKEDKDEMLPVTYPNMSYGFSEVSSEPKPILVKN
ncbi:MAG: amidohydrolase family protein, partial [Psychroflexus sp.]|nr:amidohydrolase family protein [Psychroflexus sp.]